MIMQHYGPSNEDFDGIITKLDDSGDSLLAQSIYDTRTSNLFASASLVVDDYDDIDRIQSFVAAQHIIMHDGIVEGRGVIVDKFDTNSTFRRMREFITDTALSTSPLEVDKIDTALFDDAKTRTLATVELMRGLSGGLLTLIGYPKFVAIGSVESADVEVNSLTHQQKETGLEFAKRAISLSWRNSNLS